jgi:hypothetical protein
LSVHAGSIIYIYIYIYIYRERERGARLCSLRHARIHIIYIHIYIYACKHAHFLTCDVQKFASLSKFAKVSFMYVCNVYIYICMYACMIVCMYIGQTLSACTCE